MPKRAKVIAPMRKKTMIKSNEIEVKITGCQCFFTKAQASPEEKNSSPFNCLYVTLATAVQESDTVKNHITIPAKYTIQAKHDASFPNKHGYSP